MKKLFRMLFLIFLIIVLSACSLNDLLGKFQKGKPRNYYETLDLSTPEKAVKTFTKAFQKEDFMTVYLVFDQSTQFRIPQYLNLMRYADLFKIEYRERVFEDISCISEGLGTGEHSCGDVWYLFDDLMLSAKEHSALLIDLSGNVKIIDSKRSETSYGDDAVDVITTVDGIEGEVVFRMLQSPSGRWRVYQVILEGGDEEIVPWAVPNGDE